MQTVPRTPIIDTPRVIAPPPLIFGGALTAGVVADWYLGGLGGAFPPMMHSVGGVLLLAAALRWK